MSNKSQTKCSQFAHIGIDEAVNFETFNHPYYPWGVFLAFLQENRPDWMQFLFQLNLFTSYWKQKKTVQPMLFLMKLHHLFLWQLHFYPRNCNQSLDLLSFVSGSVTFSHGNVV